MDIFTNNPNLVNLSKETINDLVPTLLGKTEECSKNLSDRVKINGIFSEFDAYTHENFQKFIKMSQQRYKSIKSGNHLQRKLQSQRPEYDVAFYAGYAAASYSPLLTSDCFRRAGWQLRWLRRPWKRRSRS